MTNDWIDENEEICGDTYDHDLQEVEVRDGIRTEVCRRCGAELAYDVETGECW